MYVLIMLIHANWALFGLDFTNLNLILNDCSLFAIKLSKYEEKEIHLKLKNLLFSSIMIYSIYKN